MKGNSFADQEQAQDLISQGPSSSPAAGEDQGGWGRLDVGLLRHIASRLQKWNLGEARLVCRQWAAELPQGCTGLTVSGKGPDGWEHLFWGLEELTWMCPKNAVQFLPAKLRSLRLFNFSDGDLRMLGSLSGLASLTLGGHRKHTELGMKELDHMPSLTSLTLSGGVDI